jgi:hypothetical protein
VPTIDNGQHFIASLANPFPNGIARPVGTSLGPNTYVGNNISFFNTNLESGYNQRWNASIERLLPQKILLEIGYAGSRVVRLPISDNLNALPDQYLSRLPVRDQAVINRLTAQVPNPFYPTARYQSGWTDGRSTTTASTVSAVWQHDNSDESGLFLVSQLAGARRTQVLAGYSLLGAYTFSKLMEATTYQEKFAGFVRAAGSFVRRDLGIRAQRARSIHSRVCPVI